jgi:hypothetical protein
MNSLITLMVGLMAAGAAAAYSEFSLTAPTAIQSYIFSIPELNEFQVILVGVALIVIGSFREYLRFIDHKGLDAEKSADSEPLSV